MSAKLGELISGVKRAIIDAHRSVGNQHLEELRQFFEYYGDATPPPAFPDGQWRPRTVQINVPRETSLNGKVSIQDHLVNVPLITLLPLRSYLIERAEVLTKVNLNLSSDGNNTPTEATAGTSDWEPDNQADVTVQMTPTDAQSAELKIIIQGLDTPPGLQRLNAAYEKLLNAQLPT